MSKSAIFTILISSLLFSQKLCFRTETIDQSNSYNYPTLKAHNYKEIKDSCWGEFYDRGVGKIPNQCEEGHHYEAGLCYKDCEEGWSNFVCQCRKGWHFKNRGCGTIPLRKCHEGEEMLAGLCYKKCKEGYNAHVTMCTPDCKKFGKKVNCGGLCMDSYEDCSTHLKKTIDDFFEMIGDIVIFNMDDFIKKAKDFSEDLAFPVCSI